MPLSIDLITRLLEAIGLILTSSYVIGEERLTKLENAIRTYLHVRKSISRLDHIIRPITTAIFRALHKIITGVYKLTAFMLFQLIYGLLIFLAHWIIQTTLGKTAAEIAIQLLIAASLLGIFPLILYSNWLIQSGWHDTTDRLIEQILDVCETLGVTSAFIISCILYGIIFLPLIISYLVTFTLLIPFLIADHISELLKLRPILVVLGVIIGLVGIFLSYLIEIFLPYFEFFKYI